ncbi:hypothetical protein AB205_0219140, partial [Aquarana catesbeiana]
PQYLTAHLGEHDISKEGTEQRIRVEKAIKYSSYNDKTLNFDFMLVKLAEPAQFNKYVQPIPIATSCPTVGSQCLVSGWGTQESLECNMLQNYSVLISLFCRTPAVKLLIPTRSLQICFVPVTWKVAKTRARGILVDHWSAMESCMEWSPGVKTVQNVDFLVSTTKSVSILTGLRTLWRVTEAYVTPKQTYNKA